MPAATKQQLIEEIEELNSTLDEIATVVTDESLRPAQKVAQITDLVIDDEEDGDDE
jgi:hypothetical protein